MKVKVIQAHTGEGIFPKFTKGTPVLLGSEACEQYPHWWPCEIHGCKTYVPEYFVVDRKLTRDYNPSELVQDVGDILAVQEIVYSWLLATNDKGVTGWIPAKAVVSINDYE